MDSAFAQVPHASHVSVPCSHCNLREICLPVGLAGRDLQLVDEHLVTQRHKVHRGDKLFAAGDRFGALYAVWTGFFKTSIAWQDGREQVTGFHMGGELVGMDGIGRRTHEVDAVALEDSQVCVIPYEAFEVLALEVHALQQQFYRVMSREIMRNQGVMLLLGSMFAEERLAAFLLNLTARLHARGYSSTEFVLRMSREDIGSYLGLTLETVSRTFTKFQAQGLLTVRHRQVTIIDPAGLQWLVEGHAH